MACAASMSIRTSTSTSSATTAAFTVTSLSKQCLGWRRTICRRAIGTSPPAQIPAKALGRQGAYQVAERRPPECDRTAAAKPKPSTKTIPRWPASHQIWADVGQRDKPPSPRPCHQTDPRHADIGLRLLRHRHIEVDQRLAQVIRNCRMWRSRGDGRIPTHHSSRFSGD
jgi:hypothetical protein